MNKRLLNISELADYLGFSTSVIRKWVRQRTIPYDKIEGTIRFDTRQIDLWLQQELASNGSRQC